MRNASRDYEKKRTPFSSIRPTHLVNYQTGETRPALPYRQHPDGFEVSDEDVARLIESGQTVIGRKRQTQTQSIDPILYMLWRAARGGVRP